MTTYRVEEIDRDFYVLRVNDRYTRFFEALWEIPEGITYNAYLLKTSEGAILFDGWKKPFSGQFIDALESVIKPEELKYVVVNHMEPDHSGSLVEVIRWSPQVQVLGHPMAGRMLAAYPGAREKFKPVKDGELLELGGERIQFIHTPWLHWPETMMSWLVDRRILISCDAFGGYGVPYGLFDDECTRWEDALRAMQKYVVTVIGHYSQWIIRNLDKLEKASVRPRMIAPAHGLIWRSNPSRVVEIYRNIALGRPKEGKVLIVYASMYGTIESLVRRLTCRLSRQGKYTVVYGYTDTTRPYTSEILTDAVDSEAIVIAAPTYESTVFPLMKYLLNELCWKTPGGKKVVVLTSYGWGSIAGRRLKEQLESCKNKVVEMIEYNMIGPQAISPEEANEIATRIAEIIG
ncbi:MAG: FprA family A-type flavoprotein [Desulfurococcales archaeon]|nr:FprA family A-type flavoprotein [Desulfurococcales archaeon]